MTATYLHCSPLSDDFNQYTSDLDFQNVGEGSLGPWSEFPSGSAILWEPSKIKVTGSPTGLLFMKAMIDPAALAPCVLTVDLLEFDPPGAAGLRLFGGQVDQGISYDGAAVSAFGQTPVTVSLPISMAIVVDSGKLFGLYSTNGGAAWNVLPPTGGEPLAGALMNDVTVTLPVSGGGTARFDNFNTHPTTPSVLEPQ